MAEAIISSYSVTELEQQISKERERLSSDRMDISFGELINLYKNKELIIRPEYQRLYRWNTKQKTALIESLLLSIPIPPIFVSEDSNGIWELVDGLQRVATFISFFGELDQDVSSLPPNILKDDEISDEEEEENNNINIGNAWKMGEGSLLKSLDGFDVNTLPSKYKINLKRAVCRVEILRGENNNIMKYELFKRLNSNGSKLTPQEIRNAIYRGIDASLNDLITELSQYSKFQELVSLSKQKKQELYDQELILRFIAYFENIEKVNDNTENYLNKFMESIARKNEQIDLLRVKTIFKDVINLIYKLNDLKVFRNHSNFFVPADFEGIMIGTAQNIDKYRTNLSALKDRIDELKSDKDFKKYSGTASNSRSRIKNRLTRANAIFSK